MATARLTVDLGNTSAKLCVWGPGAPAEPSAALEVETPDDPALERFLAALPAGTRAAFCAVGAPELERALTERLAAAVGSEALERPAPGVLNLCRDPHTTGLDRLFAARGAWERLSAGGAGAAGCLVVDVGTALTVDAVVAGAAPGSRSPGARCPPARFLGGAIAPGPRLLAAALAGGTARLPRVTPEAGAPALGRDTAEAIRAGIATGLRGAARELVVEIARAAGLDDPPVFLSGGARAFLLNPGPFVAGTLVVDPALVHRGLLAALGEIGESEERP